MSCKNQFLILSNEIGLDDDGWALIAPFGEHSKTRVAKVNGRAVEQKFIQMPADLALSLAQGCVSSLAARKRKRGKA